MFPNPNFATHDNRPPKVEVRHYRKKVQKTMKTIQIDNMTYIQDPVDHQFYRLSPEDARRPMSFKRAVKQCWEKYAIFDGRSRRSEYWWFCLFTILVILLPLAFSLLMLEAFDGVSQGMEMVGYVVAILMLILIVGVAIILMFPCLSVLTRRLHDVGRSGWWVFWDVVLSGASSLALSVAFSFTGIGESSICSCVVDLSGASRGVVDRTGLHPARQPQGREPIRFLSQVSPADSTLMVAGRCLLFRSLS